MLLSVVLALSVLTGCAESDPVEQTEEAVEAEITEEPEETLAEETTEEKEEEPEVEEKEEVEADVEEKGAVAEEIKEEVAETEKADAAETETETETEKAETTETETKPETEVKEETTTTTASADFKYDLDRVDDAYWDSLGVYDWEYDTVLELTKNHEPTDEWLAKHGSYLKTGIASIDKPVLLTGDMLGDAWISGSWNKQKGLDPKNYYDFLSKCTNLTLSPEEFIAQNNIVEVRCFDTILPGGIEVTNYAFVNADNQNVADWLVSKK